MKLFWQYLLCISLLLPATAGVAQEIGNNIDARKRAVDYFHLESVSLQEQERYDEAFEMLEYCYSLDSASTAIKYFLAPYYSILGKDSIACGMLEEIVRRDPANEEYNDALVNQYARTGNWKAAIDVYERIVGSAHSKSEIYKALYALYYNDDNFGKALETLDKIESLEGKSTELTAKRLQLYLLQNRHDEMIAIIEQAIAENPDDSRFMTFLGDAYTMIEEYGLAEDTYNKVLAKYPDDAPTLGSLVNLYAKTENDVAFCNTIERLIKCEKVETETRIENLVNYILYKEAGDSTYIKPFFMELLQLPFDQLELHVAYADYLEYKKVALDELIPVYEKIVELDSENITAIIKLLQFSIEADDKDAVFKYASEALLYLPQMPELYFYKGFSVYMNGGKQESIEIYKEGLAKRGSDTEPDIVAAMFTAIGDTYHELEMRKECYEAYDSALAYNPYKLDVLNNYSYFLALENKELQKALEMSGKTISAEPDNQTFLDTYAWILFKLKRYEEAKAYAEKIISLDEELSYEVLHHIGDIFAKCGDIEKAVIYWEKALIAGDDTKKLYKKIKKGKIYNEKKR